MEQNSENTLYCNGFAVYNETVTFNKDVLCKGSVTADNINKLNETIIKICKKIEKIEKRLALLEGKNNPDDRNVSRNISYT